MLGLLGTPFFFPPPSLLGFGTAGTGRLNFTLASGSASASARTTTANRQDAAATITHSRILDILCLYHWTALKSVMEEVTHCL